MFETKGELALVFCIAIDSEFRPSSQSNFQSSETNCKTLIIRQGANL